MKRREIIKTFEVSQTKKKVTKTTKTTKTTKATKTTKPKSKKILYEDSLNHITVPNDYKLPSTFIKFHKPHFIKGINHILSVDPTLYPVIVSQNFERFKNEEENSIKSQVLASDAKAIKITSYWLSLMSSVMAQQISGSAASAIYGRFEQLFDSGDPNPEELLTKLAEELRGIGLSSMKVKYVIDISEKFSDSDCPLTNVDFYQNSSLPEIIEELVKLKGVGEWSAKMFALFTLKEWDVFAETDLGVARGASFYLSKRPELVDEIKLGVKNDENLKKLLLKKGKFEGKKDWIPYHDQYLIYLSNKFKPYRSIMNLIFWRLSSTNIEVLEKNE